MELLQSLLREAEELNPTEVLSKLQAAEKNTDDASRNSKGFALEDENGNLVRVFVPGEQADDFERALAQLLDDHKEDDTEIAEILYRLKGDFDVIDVQWSEGAIPEDEEVNNKLPADGEPVDADVEGPEGENPGGGAGPNGQAPEGGDENPMDASELDVSGTGTGDEAAMSALDKIIDMMKSDTEARKAEADARKAEAAVQAGKVAAQAAASKSRAEEEIMDMENFNKKQKEEKRQRDLQAKLIRYRHDSKNLGESAEEYPEATPEEEEVMDMEYEQEKESEEKSKEATRAKLNKWRHRKKKEPEETEEKLKEAEDLFKDQYPGATPEEEEVLDMENWEKEEKERKKREQTHERIKRYRHAVKKKPSEEAKPEEEESTEGAMKLSFADFMGDEGRQEEVDDIIDLSHRVQS